MKAPSPQGPYLLAIETATAQGAVALYAQHQLLGSLSIHRQQSHARLLMPMIDHLLQAWDLTAQDLDGIAVSKGPGSYTGLRVGVSTAKGLCFAIDKPLLSYDSLYALAAEQRELAQQVGALIIPMIDARRMEVYCSVFDSELNQLRAIEAQVIAEDSFKDLLERQKIIFCGDGAEKCRAVLSHSPQAIVLGQALASASSVGDYLWKKWRASDFEDLVSFEPFYLKQFRVTKSKDPLKGYR
ncbi:MAG: tRNA (adenosine(37)-N6)-threonylcarbamoyltransferase complex dimerization subunit type 1 TsaB [Bacteroidota bacterium]